MSSLLCFIVNLHGRVVDGDNYYHLKIEGTLGKSGEMEGGQWMVLFIPLSQIWVMLTWSSYFLHLRFLIGPNTPIELAQNR